MHLEILRNAVLWPHPYLDLVSHTLKMRSREQCVSDSSCDFFMHIQVESHGITVDWKLVSLSINEKILQRMKMNHDIKFYIKTVFFGQCS